MILKTYLYCDLLNPANSVVCSLQSYFGHFGEPTLSPKTLNLVRGRRRRTYDFEYNYRCIWLIIKIILDCLSFVCFLIANTSTFLFKTVPHDHKRLCFMCINSELIHTKIVSRRSKIRKICFSNYLNWINKISINKYMFHVSCQNIENFSRNSYFQVGGLHVRVRVLILVCALNL